MTPLLVRRFLTHKRGSRNSDLSPLLRSVSSGCYTTQIQQQRRHTIPITVALICRSPPPIAGRETRLRTAMQNHLSGATAAASTSQRPDRASPAPCTCTSPPSPLGRRNCLICYLQYMLDHPDEGDNHNMNRLPGATAIWRSDAATDRGLQPADHARLLGNLLLGNERDGPG